jgi:hypothetical protein
MTTKDLEQQISADLARQPAAREDGQDSRKKKNSKPLATDTFSVQEAGRRLGLGKNASSAERIDFKAVNHAALVILPALLARLLPGGRVIGAEFVARNPRRLDRHLGSFKVCLSGKRAGAWADFATGDRGGDIISLIAYVENIRQSEAARLLARMFGIDLGGHRHA